MRFHIMTAVAAVAFGAGAMVAPHLLQAAEAPPMGGGYTDVIPIPVKDPAIKEIAGALFKPQGAGPFPVVVYMPPCGGPNFPLEFQQEKVWIEGMLSKGIATFIVDPLMPRGQDKGNCDKLLTVLSDAQNKNEAVLQLLKQGGDDAVAALKVVKAMPDIDPKKVFLMGFSAGAAASLHATDPKAPGAHDTEIAGVVAYYPLCYDNVEASVPTLVLIGEKDDWTGPVAACQALKSKNNFEVVVYPGATHSFDMRFDKPFDFAGHHLAYDETSAKEAAQRTEAFIDAHLK
ncbi:MAG TPA: dienelactone hydrolase family protein [Gammaproteobacteria bacterium]|nr:dienelactone hydrolase family protein [Gammaproteobacteria bacterium]